MVDVRNPQLPAPGAFKLVHEDRLHGLRPPVLPVLPAPACGPADAQEVGRAQAGPVMPLVGETLNEIRAQAVAILEVARQAAQDAAQDMAGKVRATHRRADQEAAQAGNALKMRPAPLVVPPDPAVPRRDPQRRGGKSRRPEPAVRRAHEIADLASGEGRDPVRVLARDQRVPQGTLGGLRDRVDAQALDPRRVRRHPCGFGDAGLDQARPSLHRRRLRRRKRDAGHALGQDPQRLHAAGKPGAPARVEERELLADPPAQGGPAVEPFPRQDSGYPGNRRLVPQCADDLGLCHGSSINRQKTPVQRKIS